MRAAAKAALVAVAFAATACSSALEPATTAPAPAPTPPRSAWSERLFLERQLHERPVAPPRIERNLQTPVAEPTSSPWSTRNLGEAP